MKRQTSRKKTVNTDRIVCREFYLVSTPIGNLGDITRRALDVLAEVDLVMAEDTRTTGMMLKSFDIKNRLISYNAFHESAEKKIAALFASNEKIALVSECGTPGILDPGIKVVNFCHKNGVRIIPVPGPSAGTTCLSVSGFPVKNSLFYGFLPNKKGKRKNILFELLETEKKVIIFYESPHRIQNFLQILGEFDPALTVFIGREMTKKFEEYLKKTVKELLDMYENLTLKGEFVIIVNNAENRNTD